MCRARVIYINLQQLASRHHEFTTCHAARINVQKHFDSLHWLKRQVYACLCLTFSHILCLLLMQGLQSLEYGWEFTIWIIQIWLKNEIYYSFIKHMIHFARITNTMIHSSLISMIFIISSYFSNLHSSYDWFRIMFTILLKRLENKFDLNKIF